VVLNLKNKVLGSVNIEDVGVIYFRSLTLRELNQVAGEHSKDVGKATALSILFGACDEHGNNLFTDENAVLDLPVNITMPLAEAIGDSIQQATKKKS
jgi:hypothetical protein